MDEMSSPQQRNNPWFCWAIYLVTGLSGLAALFFGLLALFVVPAPGARTAVEVSGSLVSISEPHPQYGDIGIVLDQGRRYYINRANEIAGFDWAQMLSELRPGDQVSLTVVIPFGRRLTGEQTQAPLPVAGIRTPHKTYLDAAIASHTWTAQAHFSRLAWISLAFLAITLIFSFVCIFKRNRQGK